MTRASAAVTVEHATAVTRSVSARPVLSLARAEGRRLLIHPVFLAGVAFSLLGNPLLTGVSFDPRVQSRTLLTGLGLLPLAAGTLLAVNLAALRGRRYQTEELYASAPVTSGARTAAHLLSVASAVATGIVLVAAAAVFVQASGGAEAALDRNHRVLSFDLMQGPAVVMVLGVLGVLLARWLPSQVVGPLAILLIVSFAPAVIQWPWGEAPGRWLAPLPVAFSEKLAEPAATMGWHLLYLTGLAVLLGSAAVLRHGRNRGLGIWMAVGLTVATAAGILQLASKA